MIVAIILLAFGVDAWWEGRKERDEEQRSYTESWTPRAGGETTAVVGKGVALFERGSDGSWKLTHFVWNHDG